jgi:alcohol dehydrogenase YqhD (iron-dependent ADH family)
MFKKEVKAEVAKEDKELFKEFFKDLPVKVSFRKKDIYYSTAIIEYTYSLSDKNEDETEQELVRISRLNKEIHETIKRFRFRELLFN